MVPATTAMPMNVFVSALTHLLFLLQFLKPTSFVIALESITDSNVKAAVQLWISDGLQARSKYGDISEWDVSAVTSLAKSKYDEWSAQ